jgi:Arm DNA-binding domain/Phage integrase, N-terminal SAM-like domain
MATIEKYETTSGATRYRVRYRTPNKRQTQKRGFATKRDAQAWADQLEVDKRKGAYVAPAAGRVKLGDYAWEWLESKHKLKPSTRATYRVIIDTAIARRADIALGDISRQLVREWVADLSVDLAPATVHKTIGVLRQVLAMAVAENRLVMNPVDGVELPSVWAAEQRFVTLAVAHPGRRGWRPPPSCVRAGHVRTSIRWSQSFAGETSILKRIRFVSRPPSCSPGPR